MGNKPSDNRIIPVWPDQIMTRDQVWKKYNNDNISLDSWGNCYCCNALIQYGSPLWCCSPVDYIKKNVDLSLYNLRPCCTMCHQDRGHQNIYRYISKHYLQGPGSKILHTH